MLVLGDMVPALHGIGADTPTPQECPVGQVGQCICDWSPDALPKLPSAHGAALALTLPASQ